MIHYQLVCDADHEFDGWFKDSAAFERQATRKLLECPICGGTAVRRALMAPAVGRARSEKIEKVKPAEKAQPAAAPENADAAVPPAAKEVAVSPQNLPAAARAMLQKLRAEVEKNCDYVGADFAEEARRVHYGESTRSRNIYGEATAEEAGALAEEGIDVSRIPWVPLADS